MAYDASQNFLVTVPAAGGALIEGEIGVPRSVNPVLAFTDADKDVTALVYAGLMRRDASGNLVPDLAQSYTVSPDGLTYDFILKSSLKFDDGTPITADDVVFTVNKTQDAALEKPAPSGLVGCDRQKSERHGSPIHPETAVCAVSGKYDPRHPARARLRRM